MLERGADVTAVDLEGGTPLIDAASEGCDVIVRDLLEHGGSDIDGADDHGRTACRWACSGGHLGVLRQLLEAGADPTLRDTLGRTSLDHAASHRHQHCVSILQDWHRAFMLKRTRSVREASLVVANSRAPVDAAPTYLAYRTTLGQPMPRVCVSTRQQHAQPSDDVGEEGHVEVDPIAVEGVVTVYVIEELNGEVFVELMELMGITGSVI